MKVLKFGGSSVNTPEIIRQVRSIIEQEPIPCLAVISAIKGVTDQLLQLHTLASTQNPAYKSELESLIRRHSELVNESFTDTLLKKVREELNILFAELTNITESVYQNKDTTLKSRDYIASFGELFSATILSHVIKEGEFVDARKLIVTNSHFGKAQVDQDITNKNILSFFSDKKGRYIIPGFIARDTQGNTTTMGRGGSDFSSSIFASALNAKTLEIWSDVEGFMTADPLFVAKAHAIEKMSYAEAIELSHFGAKVIYTPTIQPVYKKNIPIHIKNIFNPSGKGTLITHTEKVPDKSMIAGVSSIHSVSLVTLQGTGMVGVPGTSMRLFGALAKADVNVILITQASSEYSITFAIMPEDSSKAIEAIKAEFHDEMTLRNEIIVREEKDLSIVAIVGEQMKNTPGIAANLFRSLSRNGISAIAIAQGSSELNVSVVIKKDLLRKALNAIHEGFFLTGYKELNVFLIGTGVVGGALLDQLRKQQSVLLKNRKLNIKVAGILNLDGMLLEEGGINLSNWDTQIIEKGETASIDSFVERIKLFNLRNSVLVDCTASAAMADKYFELLDSFVSVVTPNKVANSSSYTHYLLLKNTARKRGVKFMYETNVGAGLPIINTINDLILSGDNILKIEAVLSGTLNFIFNTISAEIPMSKAIRLAQEKGYSEPDPRIDLSGIDVVRKILILCREFGYAFEKEDIEVNTFLPKECFEGSLDDFWKKVEKYDADFEERRKTLESQNKRWRFVAILNKGKASVQLIEVDIDHPAYNLAGSNNIILLTTERYKELPMVIKGYGAGSEVTAAGVFADIIRVANV